MNYYTDEQKRVISNYFLYTHDRTDNAKKEYLQFADEFIYRLKKKLDKHSQDNFNSHQWMWDGEHNLVTYLLSQKNLDTSHNRLYALNMTRPNWHHQDNQGNTCLHLMISNYDIETVAKVAQNFHIDVNIQNNNNEYFTYYFFKPSYYRQLEKKYPHALNFYTHVSSGLKHCVDMIEQYPQHFSEENTLVALDEQFQKSKRIIFETNKSLKTLQHEPGKFEPHIINRIEDIMGSCESYLYDIEKHWEKYLLYYKLNHNLPEHDDSTVRTPKI